MDNYSRNAKFDNVKYDEEAVLFHSMKYEMGFKYPLSIACYQLTQITKMKEDRLNEVRIMP
jgi:hypothetical protein